MKRVLISIFTWAALWAGAAAAGTASRVTADTATLARGLQLDNVVVYGSQNNFGVASSQMSATTLSKQQIMAVPVFLGDPMCSSRYRSFQVCSRVPRVRQACLCAAATTTGTFCTTEQQVTRGA